MGGFHLVKQGEHISSIAAQNGFHDFHSIWDRPENSSLRQQRDNPHVLAPGDQLFVPDKETKDYSRPTDQHHRFKLKGKPLQLRLFLDRMYYDPIANAPCVLSVEAEVYSLTSSGQGEIKHTIPKTAEHATLRIQDKLSIEVPILIGHLDPVDQVSGQLARLANLGYYRGSPDDSPPDKIEFPSAMEEFQCEHNLTVDGICGPATQAKLKEVHGC